MANTALASNLVALSWEEESAFAINTDDTVTVRHQIRDDQIDVSNLRRDLIERGGAHQYVGEKSFPIPGAFGVSSFTFRLDAYSTGGAHTSSISETNLSKLLAHAIGNTSWTQAGVAAIDSGTPTQLTDAASPPTLSAGGMLRVGAKGDTRADGQWTVLDKDDDESSPFDLAVALPGTPTTDAVHAAGMAYPVSDTDSGTIITSNSSTSNNTLRFTIQSANYQWVCRGCVVKARLVGLNPGDKPEFEFEVMTVAWNPISATWPSTVATSDNAPAVCTGGEFFYNALGTATANIDALREFSIDLGHEYVPVNGSGASTVGQSVVGWRRLDGPTTVSFAVESEAVTASPEWHGYHLTDPNSIVAKHMLYGCSIEAGTSLAVYCPNLMPSDTPPTQVDIDGLNYVRVTMVAATDLSASSDTELTRSRYRIGFA